MSYIVYGLGDVGTDEVLRALKARRLLIEFRDIRIRVGDGMRDLLYLRDLKLKTVPQIWDSTGRYVGGYDEIMMRLR